MKKITKKMYVNIENLKRDNMISFLAFKDKESGHGDEVEISWYEKPREVTINEDEFGSIVTQYFESVGEDCPWTYLTKKLFGDKE